MNRVVLTGNLAKDPDIKTVGSGKMCATFDLAVQRRFRDKETGKRECDFIRCVAWNQAAEYINNYCAKGHRLAIDGSIQVRTWQDDKQQKHWSTEIIVDNVESLQSRSETAGNVVMAAPKIDAQSGFAVADDDESPLPF